MRGRYVCKMKNLPCRFEVEISRLGMLGTYIGRYPSGVANSPCNVRGWVLDVLVCGVPILEVPTHVGGLAV